MVERDGHEGAVDVGEDLVLVGRPLGEAREELVHAIVGRVVDVGTVLVDEHARLVIAVVGVARDVATALEHADLEAARLGETPRADGARVAGTDDDRIV